MANNITENQKIEKPSVLFDNGLNRSETIIPGRRPVTNKDPNYHYAEIRMDDKSEIQKFADMGYEPARGDETYDGTKFDELLSDKKPEKGGLKVRGNRLLVRIRKDVYDKRNKEKINARHHPAKKAGEIAAREMVCANQGAIVKSLSKDE